MQKRTDRRGLRESAGLGNQGWRRQVIVRRASTARSAETREEPSEPVIGVVGAGVRRARERCSPPTWRPVRSRRLDMGWTAGVRSLATKVHTKMVALRWTPVSERPVGTGAQVRLARSQP